MAPCALLALVLTGTPPALAAKAKTASSEVLKPRPVFETDGSFGFCLADTAFDDGRNVTFALAPSGKMNLGVMIPKAGFKLGGQYDLDVSLSKGAEESYHRTIRAVAIDENSLILQLGKNPAFEKALGTSRMLMLEAAGRKVEFALPNTSAVMKDLADCVKAHNGKKDRVAANIESAMPEPLKAVLIEAGLKEIVPLRMDDIPAEKRPADYIWKTGNLMGGVRERLVPSDKTLAELVGLYVNGLKQGCTGTFNAEVQREEQERGIAALAADITCTSKGEKTGQEKTVFASVLFYLTPNHRFTSFTHEGKSEDKQAAITVRDALQRTILKLAKEVGTSAH